MGLSPARVILLATAQGYMDRQLFKRSLTQTRNMEGAIE